jgi:hypothetical protein
MRTEAEPLSDPSTPPLQGTLCVRADHDSNRSHRAVILKTGLDVHRDICSDFGAHLKPLAQLMSTVA